jgi:hypothetical protein
MISGTLTSINEKGDGTMTVDNAIGYPQGARFLDDGRPRLSLLLSVGQHVTITPYEEGRGTLSFLHEGGLAGRDVRFEPVSR